MLQRIKQAPCSCNVCITAVASPHWTDLAVGWPVLTLAVSSELLVAGSPIVSGLLLKSGKVEVSDGP